MSSYTLYQAVRSALMGQTTRRGDFVSVWQIANVVGKHIGDEVAIELVNDSLWSMHESGMATVNGTGAGTTARYDGILVYLNPQRKVAVVTNHGYAIGDWEYLLNPAHEWRAERIPTWALPAPSNAA